MACAQDDENDRASDALHQTSCLQLVHDRASGPHDRASAAGVALSTDTLSEVLRAVRLTGAVFFHVEGSAPWVAETPGAATVAPQIMPGAQHVIEYHLVAKGSCWGGLVGEPPIELQEGEIIVFPQGDAHVMSSAPGMRATPNVAAHRRPQRGALPFEVSYGPDGPSKTVAPRSTVAAEVVCGFLGCDARPFNPLLATLPRVLHVRAKGRDSHLAALVRLAGTPPIQYLARWRIQLAASLLTSTTFTVGEIADRVGYGSEAALSRAFKRWVGLAPSSWRMGERTVPAIP